MAVAEMPRRTVTATSGSEFVISDWRGLTKNTLRGICSITMPSGLLLRNGSVHEKAETGARWIGLPAQKYEKDCTTSYMVEFARKAARDRFNEVGSGRLNGFWRKVTADERAADPVSLGQQPHASRLSKSPCACDPGRCG